MKQCMNCGAPNPDEAKVCEKCNQPLQNDEITKRESYNGTTRWNRGTLQPHSSGSAVANMGAKREEGIVKGFSLMMIPDPHENIMPFAEKFEGDSVSLNRFNTDRTNKTITSKEQARVVNVDGKWFIEDHSDMKSTFVRAGRPIELHSGDMILLGDRVFRFDDLSEGSSDE